MTRWLRLGRQLLIAIGGVIYTLLLLKATISSDSRALSISLALVPVVLFLLYLAWGSRYRYPLLLVMLFAAALLWVKGGDALVAHYHWFYLLQHVGIYAGLAYMFGRTLVSGVTPLVSRFAAIVHGELQPEQAHYTRQVTLAWALFFALSALLSTLLFLLAPIEVWAIFANLISPLMVGLMFAGEHLVRHRMLPHMKHANLVETIRISSRHFREQSSRPRS